jgi:hypothetical protein
MNDPISHPNGPLSMDEGVNVLISNAQQTLRESYRDCEQRIRRSPTSSVLAAVLAGYCAHRLPLRAIAVAQVRVIAALAPPALFLFGAAKVFEFLQRQQLSRITPRE